MKDRRLYKRLAVEVPIELKTENTKTRSATKAYLFNAKNIGEAGLFLQTPLKYKKNQQLEFTINTGEKIKSICIIGKVVWIARKEDHPYMYPGVGIKFEKISDKNRKNLKEFLKKRLKNYKDAKEMKSMYFKLKDMAAKLVTLEEAHPTASKFKKIIDKAVSEIDDAAHTIDREIIEIKKI